METIITLIIIGLLVFAFALISIIKAIIEINDNLEYLFKELYLLIEDE